MLDGVLAQIAWEHLALAVLAWALLTAGSLAVVLRIVLALPHDYFEVDAAPRTAWTAARVARNVAGILLIGVGTLLSFPGVPGQGALTVLVGMVLIDFPRRQQLERALARRPGVLPLLSIACAPASIARHYDRRRRRLSAATQGRWPGPARRRRSDRVPACERSVAARRGSAASRARYAGGYFWPTCERSGPMGVPNFPMR